MTKNTANETAVAATSSNRPTPDPRSKRYDEAFKGQGVQQWSRTGRPGKQLAGELGVSYPFLKEWKRRYHGDGIPLRADLEAENRLLRLNGSTCASIAIV